MLKIQAFKVDQWLEDWDKTSFSKDEFKSKPPKEFYLFKINAKKLLELSGIYRRTLDAGKRREGVQREHESSRLKQISGYVKEGYPLSKIKPEKRLPGDEETLRRPGWLPTSIVINILKSGDIRYGKKINPKKVIDISEKGQFAELSIPDEAFKLNVDTNRSLQNSKELPPIEVIDGQHRLLSFEEFSDEELENYELPVVAFSGLDIGWQAYLFWTINICPKRISTSLAYDLYPLLRSQDWIEREGNHKIYIEARSQEIVDYLWMNKKSPWKDRIDMIGAGYDYPSISQSTFIKSLLSSFFKKDTGFFMANDTNLTSLDVNLQAAIVIHCWLHLQRSIDSKKSQKWVQALQTESKKYPDNFNPAFAGEISLLAQDQGVKVVNDLFSFYLKLAFIHFEDELTELVSKEESSAEIVNYNLKQLENSRSLNNYLARFSDLMGLFDFRSSKSSSLSLQEKTFKQSLRGSSGYQILKKEILSTMLKNSKDDELSTFLEMMKNA